MYVNDIMTFNPVTIQPNGSVRNALDTMIEMRCHHLPVMSKNNHLVGLISDYDCHRALSAPTFDNCKNGNQHPDKITVKSVMTPAPTVVAPEDDVIEAARLMFTNNIRCLPVMRDETLVGIITTSDILIAFIQMNQPEKSKIIAFDS